MTRDPARPHRRAALRMAAGAIAAATLAAAAQASAILRGTATYRERMALPPGAVLEVALLDISRADAPAERIAEARMPVTGQVPIPFALPYDPARIDPARRYAVEGRILLDGRIAFRTDTIHPVLTRGAGEAVELRLVRATDEPAAGAVPEGLVGPTWVAVEIAGEEPLAGAEANLVFLDGGQVAGTGGCNRLRGGWQAEGDQGLAFGPMASTMMACDPPIAEQERRFLDALGEVRRWRFENAGRRHLLLLDGRGTLVLRLRAPG